MSHWTKTAVITLGLAAGIGAGVAWTSSSSSLPDGQNDHNWGSRPISPDLRSQGNGVDASLSGYNGRLDGSPVAANPFPENLDLNIDNPGPDRPDLEEDEPGWSRHILETPEVDSSDTEIQTVDVFVAQAPRQSASSEEDNGSESASPDNNDGANTPDDEQATNSQAPPLQPSPQPRFSPVTPQPLSDPRTDPETEIRAIRRELLQLLNRLEVLESRLESGPEESAQSSNSTDATSSSVSSTVPSPEPSPPASSFFDGPPPPQLSLGTQTISLPGDVLFDFNRSEIRPEAANLLEQVAGILESMPYSHIQVAGHTDDVGDNDYNLVLSVERATAVQEFLRDALPDNGQGYRWTATGYGEAAPVAGNDTEEGRQRNRRVDLIVSPQ